MESIFEGVIVIDRQRRIEVINHAARSLLGLSQPARQLRGQSIDSVISPQPFFASGDMLERDTHDELCRFNQLTVLASRVRIMLENTLQGWVITFRDRNEINALTAQLSQVKRYVDNLRIMRHEQLNRMTTLSGLLHMGHYDEAIRYIQAQSEHAQELLDFISSHFHSPTLCGLLLGKATRAREKGVALSFDPACRIDRPLPSLMESELISIIGNLLDNAIEATQRAELPHEPVEVLIQLNARELIIEVADRGVASAPISASAFLNAASPPKPVAITALVCILLNIMSLRRAAPSKSPITRRGERSSPYLSRPTRTPVRNRRPTMHHDLVDVLIIEDESELARLHAELVQKHPRLRLAGMAASLAQARSCFTPRRRSWCCWITIYRTAKASR